MIVCILPKLFLSVNFIRSKTTRIASGRKSTVSTVSKIEQERGGEVTLIEHLLSVRPWGELADLYMASH